jgi:hypothetical protein
MIATDVATRVLGFIPHETRADLKPQWKGFLEFVWCQTVPSATGENRVPPDHATHRRPARAGSTSLQPGQGPAYQMLSQEIAKRVMTTLKGRK